VLLALAAAAGHAGAAASWPLAGPIDVGTHSFQFRREGSWKNRNGTTQGVYRGRLTLSPRVLPSGHETLLVDLGAEHSQLEQLERTDPADPAAAPWRKEIDELQVPYRRVRGVRAYFDRGWSQAEESEAPLRELTIPPGATQLRRVECDWEWTDQHRTLVFALENRPNVSLGLLAALAGCAAAVWVGRRKKEELP
jgi:hypothetical protein